MDSDSRTRSPVFRLGGSLTSAAAMAERTLRRVRLVRASIAVAATLAVGTWGYWYLSDGQHTLVQALYMTVISISTVGFTEVIPIQDDTMRLFTMGLILFGGASVLYFLTAIASYVVEGDFLYGFWRRRMRSRLGRAQGHAIVCGLGRVGAHTFGELVRSGVQVVGIDREPARVESLMNEHGPRILFMVGDAADEEVLRELGIARARTLVAALADDRDNFLLCVTARQLNPRVRLMVRLFDPARAEMFDELEADAVVHPPALSGVRLAKELLLPELTAFTDHMLEAPREPRTLREVVVAAGSPAVGRSITALVGKANAGALVLGVRRAGTDRAAAFPFGPSWEHRVAAGDALFVLATRRGQRELELRLAGAREATATGSGGEPPSVMRPTSTALRAVVTPGTGSVVVAGAGAVGRFAVRELLRQGVPVTVIDRDPTHLALLEPHPALESRTADVAQRTTLAEAGVGEARGFITALQPLRDNLFLAASVRHLNPAARVVARVGSRAESRRLRAVGAAVVNPGYIGGMHMAHLTMRPELVAFTRGLEASWDHPEQLAVIGIARLAPGVKTLGDLAPIEATGCVVLGLRSRSRGAFVYHPDGKARVRVGGELVALGEPAQIDALRALVGP